MSNGDDKVKPLPVKFKQRPADDAMLKVVESWSAKDECNHRTVYKDGAMRDVGRMGFLRGLPRPRLLGM